MFLGLSKKAIIFCSFFVLLISNTFFALDARAIDELEEPFSNIYNFSDPQGRQPFEGIRTLFGSGQGQSLEIDPSLELENELKQIKEGDLGPNPLAPGVVLQDQEQPIDAETKLPQVSPQARKIVTKIEVAGNKLVLDKEILELVNSQTSSPLSRRQVVSDLKAIYSMGFFKRDSIEAKPIENSDGTITLQYTVEENPPVTDIEIYGAESIKDVDSYDVFVDVVGKPENVKLLTAKIRELENLYLEKGYIIARVKDIDLEEDGTLKIYVDEGTISQLKFTGNRVTKEKYLRYLVSSAQEGQPYNERKFLEDFKRIQGTNYFATVSRSVIPDESGEGYILEVQLQEKKTTSIGIGGGVNSSVGLFGNANITKGNVRGMGEQFNFNAVIGSGVGADNSFNNNSRLFNRDQITQLSASYTVPYYKGTKDTLTYSGRYLDGPSFIVDLADQSLYTAGLSLTKPIDRKNSLNFSLSGNNISLDDSNRRDYIEELTDNIAEDLNLDCDGKVEDPRCRGFRREARQLRNEQLDDGLFFKLGANYSYLDVDNPRKPLEGWKVRLAAQPHLSFGDVGNFTKVVTSATKYTKVGKQSTFILNARTGFNPIGDLPQFAKFRLGGNGGIRGYRLFSDLGVGDEFVVGTAEFRTPIYSVIRSLKNVKYIKDVDLALFVDAGLIGGDERLNDISNRLNEALAFGFGVRINIPLIGALRLDLGFPLIEALEDDQLFRVNFGAADQF